MVMLEVDESQATHERPGFLTAQSITNGPMMAACGRCLDTRYTYCDGVRRRSRSRSKCREQEVFQPAGPVSLRGRVLMS